MNKYENEQWWTKWSSSSKRWLQLRHEENRDELERWYTFFVRVPCFIYNIHNRMSELYLQENRHRVQSTSNTMILRIIHKWCENNQKWFSWQKNDSFSFLNLSSRNGICNNVSYFFLCFELRAASYDCSMLIVPFGMIQMVCTGCYILPTATLYYSLYQYEVNKYKYMNAECWMVHGAFAFDYYLVFVGPNAPHQFPNIRRNIISFTLIE